MMIVTDTGFAEDTWHGGFTANAAEARARKIGLDIAVDHAVCDLLDDVTGIPMIRLEIRHFADGRALSQAASLRAGGYAGRIRLAGHVLSDQYAMARRSGIDEIEISKEHAQRQPEPEWLARANWQALDHRARFSRVSQSTISPNAA